MSKQLSRPSSRAFRARNSAPVGHGVLVWFELDDFDAAVERARKLRATVVEEPRNAAFEARQRRRVALFAAPHPRFPKISEDGKVRQSFKIWHYEDEPVEIVGVKALKLYTVRANSTPQTPEVQEVDPLSIFSDTEIPPGSGVEVSVTFDFNSQDLYTLTYRLRGVSFDGKDASGELSVVKPPPKPTKENSHWVRDPALTAKIQKAMAILKQDTVSREEISRLEREGKL